jgi:hypothetical protein
VRERKKKKEPWCGQERGGAPTGASAFGRSAHRRSTVTTGEGEWGMGVSPQGSPELGRRYSDGSEGSSGGALGAGSLGHEERGRMGGGGVVVPGRPFIRSKGERGGRTGIGIGRPVVGRHYGHPIQWGEETEG